MAPFWKFWGGGRSSKKTTKTPSPPRVTDPLATAFMDDARAKKITPEWAPITTVDSPVAGEKRKATPDVADLVKHKKAKTTEDAGAKVKMMGGRPAKWGARPEDEMELFEGGLDDDVVETTEVDGGFEDEDFEGEIVHGTDEIGPEDVEDVEDDGLGFLDDYDDGSMNTADFMRKYGLKRDYEGRERDVEEDGTDEIGPEDDKDDGLEFLDDYDDGSMNTADFMRKYGLRRDYEGHERDVGEEEDHDGIHEDDEIGDGKDDEEDDEDEDEEDVLGGLPGDAHIANPADEEEVIYIDVDDDEDDDEDDEDDTDSEPHRSSTDITVFDPSVFEIAETDGSLIADVRARVGSFDADFVPSKVLLDRGWPSDTISLIRRLHQRGHEPLFPSHWLMDFRHLPSGLFLPPTAPKHKSFINSLRRKDFRATKALSRLISLGPKIRDRVAVDKAPETLVVDELQRYIEWADYDSRNQFPDYPLLQIHYGSKHEDVAQMQQRLLHGLNQLYHRWNRAREMTSTGGPEAMQGSPDLPTLYGVLVSHTLVGVVTFVPTGGEDSIGYLRSVGVFDFGEGDYDVWNSVALGLLVCHVRDVALERGCGVQRSGFQRVSVSRGLVFDPDS